MRGSFGKKLDHVLAADPVSVAAQRSINCIGTGAEIEAPKALRSETLKASRGREWGGGIPLPSRLGAWRNVVSGRKRFIGLLLLRVVEGLSLRYLYAILSIFLPLLPPLKGFEPSFRPPCRSV